MKIGTDTRNQIQALRLKYFRAVIELRELTDHGAAIDLIAAKVAERDGYEQNASDILEHLSSQ